MERAVIRSIAETVRSGKNYDLAIDACGTQYRRRFTPAGRLILLGGGHIAQALCRFASELDFNVTVADDRPEFANFQLFPAAEKILCDDFESAIEKMSITEGDYVAVLTRGHRFDAVCLRKLLKGRIPYYLGLVGSRRRVAGLFNMLAEEGYDRAELDKIYTPIGLAIKAVTPREIAISILAELIKVRAEIGEISGFLNITETDFDTLESVLDDRNASALAIVLETKGSVPADTGALMTLGHLGRIAGTIGGGCGEAEVITRSRRVLRTGVPEIAELDMTDDVAESDGMVCGGKMKVLIEPVHGV